LSFFGCNSNVEDVYLGELKEGALGTGLVPFRERFVGLETHEVRVIVSNFGESWETKREDPYEIKC